MSARVVGAAALVVVALTIVPDKDAPVAVQPVADVALDTVLCDAATVGHVHPDTPVNRVLAVHFCATRYASETVGRLARGLGIGGS